MKLEWLIGKMFDPVVMACGCFILFGAFLAAGIASANPFVEFASTGFMLAGACIGALHIANRWVNPEKIEPPTEEATTHSFKDASHPAIQTQTIQPKPVQPRRTVLEL